MASSAAGCAPSVRECSVVLSNRGMELKEPPPSRAISHFFRQEKSPLPYSRTKAVSESLYSAGSLLTAELSTNNRGFARRTVSLHIRSICEVLFAYTLSLLPAVSL